MDITNNTDRFFGVGFMQTNNTATSPQNNNASAWALLRGNDSASTIPNSEISYFGGPGVLERTDISTTTLDPSGSGIFEIVLNTQSPQWSADFSFTPDAGIQNFLGTHTFSTADPNISYVGFGGVNNDPDSAVGSVSGFSLSAIPEPSSVLPMVSLLTMCFLFRIRPSRPSKQSICF